jgi:hypothetical protein
MRLVDDQPVRAPGAGAQIEEAGRSRSKNRRAGRSSASVLTTMLKSRRRSSRMVSSIEGGHCSSPIDDGALEVLVVAFRVDQAELLPFSIMRSVSSVTKRDLPLPEPPAISSDSSGRRIGSFTVLARIRGAPEALGAAGGAASSRRIRSISSARRRRGRGRARRRTLP